MALGDWIMRLEDFLHSDPKWRIKKIKERYKKRRARLLSTVSEQDRQKITGCDLSLRQMMDAAGNHMKETVSFETDSGPVSFHLWALGERFGYGTQEAHFIGLRKGDAQCYFGLWRFDLKEGWYVVANGRNKLLQGLLDVSEDQLPVYF